LQITDPNTFQSSEESQIYKNSKPEKIKLYNGRDTAIPTEVNVLLRLFATIF